MSNNQFSGKILYLTLWGGTLCIVTVMFFIGYQQQISEKKLENTFLNNSSYPSGEAVNELMLSANDLTIEEKKAFINLFLKQENTTINGEVIPKRDAVYKRILDRKISKWTGRNGDDFSIKPVPK